MKIRIGRWSIGKSQDSYLPKHSSGTINFAVRYSLAVRLLTVMLITGLLIPLVFFGQTSKTSVQNSSSDNRLSTSVFASAESVVSSALGSFGSLVDPALSSAASVNQSVANRYQAVSDYLTIPTPPEGFAQAKVPTLWGKIFGDVSSIAASVVSPFTPTSASAAAPAPGVGKFDFDGDNKADVARWQASTGEWKVRNSSNGSFSTMTTGISSTMIIAPADYNGDGKTDYAVLNYSTGTWTIKHSFGGTTQTITGLGQSGDKVVSGKYDSDSSADAAVFRPSNGTWYVKQSSTGTIVSTAFGASTDIPTPGDYDGDGLMDFAIFRPSDGGFYVKYSSNSSVIFFQWGISTDTPVPGNYDTDSKTDFAVYRPSTGTWYINKSDGNPYIAKTWGNYGDQPVPADYDNDGKDDLAVWRATTGVWYIVKSSDATLNTYEYQTLGVAGDVPVPSAHVKQIGGPVPTYGMAKARLSPRNATGGTDLYSQNFSWGTSLVDLPGRAGLDAGFGISYNSLIWTKQFGYMIFDADNSNVSPGFRFGFPVIEPSYFDDQTGKFAYLMVTPSGGRVEFRQDAATGIYETADSTYTQLSVTAPLIGGGGGHPSTATEDLTLTVTGANGTQMTYVWKAGAFRCSKIKDRNGNFITVNHDDYGLLTSVTDTLGRVISVEYDTQKYPVAIKQTRRTNNGDATGTNVVKSLATFTYTNTTITTNFGSLGVYGPPNGTILKVLEKVIHADESYTKFEYNSYGQVEKISNYGKNQTQPLNSVQAILAQSSTPDCPRLTETRSFVKDFNNGAEIVVKNTYQENQTCSVGGLNLPATITEDKMIGHPNNLISKTCYFPAGNWSEGLAYATEDIADSVQKRWTVTSWTQDNTSLNYMFNPRVTESKVGDEANVKKTAVDYHRIAPGSQVSLYGLVSEVKVFDANQTTVLKKATTDYNLAQTYLDRRIIGLPSESKLYDQNNFLMSKVTYVYDGGDFTGSNQSITPVQHDTTNYGASFIIGRGNLTSTTRHDVINSATVSSSIKYNTAGAPVLQTDPMGREVKISYADRFNDTATTRNTFAYPTAITTAGSLTSGDITSYAKYRFDIGANVNAESPNGSGQAQAGKKTERIFDEIGRLQKETLLNNGAYTRYQYFDNQTQSKVFTTVESGAGEVEAETKTDGAGRGIESRTEMPNSIGWSGVKAVYDVLGRVKQQTVPTEVDSNWETALGDDARGDDSYGNPIYLWTSQEYDWKGRVTKQTNTDGTYKLFSYEGCGCAGGQMTTVKGEEIFESDWLGGNSVSLGRRTQKVYADIQGRAYKSQVMNWDGTTPYTTTVTQFNGRDQAVSVKQYQGAESPSNTFQEMTMTYDGHGRLKTQHRPEQIKPDTTLGYTTYNYNNDDSISSIVDARGATTNYTYDNRGLVEQISYDVPIGSNIADPSNISYGYDALGNRILMTDALGTVSYTYNELSQMTAETRAFTDTLTNAPLSGSSFKLEYTYTLAGQLKSLKDPFGQEFNYAHDKIGRLASVTGTTAFAGITNYAFNPEYDARGTLTALDYGNDVEMNITNFNNKLQATAFEVKKGSTSIIKKQYQFYDDGSLKFSKDVNNAMFDRLYKYDNVGRTTEAKSGANARGITSEPASSIPYKQNYTYNAFGNITTSTMEHFDSGQSSSIYTFTNNRNALSTYDADGNEIGDENATYEYDAAGQKVKSQTRNPENTTQFLPSILQSFDGAGQETKRVNQNYTADYGTNYYIRSSVLGKIISETNSTGAKMKTFVPANGVTLAEQHIYRSGATPEEHLTFLHQDASGSSLQQTTQTGALEQTYSGYRTAEFDALGNNVGESNPYISIYEPPAADGTSTKMDSPSYGGAAGPMSRGYRVDGIPVSEQEYVRHAETARFGAFGLIERAARMWGQLIMVGIKTDEGWAFGGPEQEGRFGKIARNHGYTLQRYFSIVGSWTTAPAIVSPPTPQTQAQQNPRTLNEGERTKLNQALVRATRELRDNTKCRDAIAGLLEKLDGIFLPHTLRPTKTINGGEITRTIYPAQTFLYNYDTQSSGYLNQYNNTNVLASGRSGSRGRNIDYGVATTNSTFIFRLVQIVWNNEYFNLGDDARALHTIHEMLHDYGSDITIANQIAKLNNSNDTFDDQTKASEYINKFLKDNCGLPTE